MGTAKKKDRFADSAAKIKPPFEIDPTMLFYSPQENVDAFEHPRIAPYLRWIAQKWQPPTDGPRLALIIPCTKSKPYPTSREHRSINRALLRAGWVPDGTGKPPEALYSTLDSGDDPRLLDSGAMFRNGIALDRIVISEPLALVPYTHVYTWQNGPSPASAYDDPGLFESRGTSVSPWRDDHTATQNASGKWTWGPAEREAYVQAHNTLVGFIHETLARVSHHYTAIGAWTSPGLTHRSFLINSAQRRAEGLPMSRRGASGPVTLRGVCDLAPGIVDIMPTVGQLEQARSDLAIRLEHEGRKHSAGTVRAVYARGDGHDTPLGLPELLDHLTAWLDKQSRLDKQSKLDKQSTSVG
ncbi:hypothetical protein [Candidatus Poriferisocius sp.]|uniref:hypothetical protein n=1 Tax=Candidatus Poriferisocius sp. TaxID=3101276 RepID=UPI003B022E15